MDYDLSRLGSREFEHLSQALAKRVLGPGVSVFGDGKDGGREASFTGPVTYPHEGQEWDGYGVVQAKFRQRADGVSSGTEWLERQVKAEFNAWLDPQSKRGRRPEYVLFTTNVVLSPVPDSGGIARIDRLIASYAAQLDLRGWGVWHFDEICRYLDIHDGVRRTYAGFVTPGDVLSRLLSTVTDADSDTAELIRAHAGRELLTDQWIRLGQAGASADNQRLRLGPVAVDLRAAVGHPDRSSIRTHEPSRRADSSTVHAAEYVIERGNSVLCPSNQERPGSRHIVLFGGPGQGKSTLGQLICQTYRVALFDEEGEHLLPGQVREVLGALRQDLAAIGLPSPKSLRWPIRIALNDYANAILGGEDVSLLRYIARKINHRATETITGAHLKRWLRTWPWILILDGLDEVASLHTREDMMSRISDFLIEAHECDADLLVVATTRPQGYQGEFHVGDYETLKLLPMSTEDALLYADRLAHVRHFDDPDMRDTVLERIATASRDLGTAHLMSTPLQVTIMSLLVEKRARMPQNRYELFETYYDTVYSREVAKPGGVGLLLADNRRHIDWVHEHVGLVLQSRAGEARQLDALLEEDDLRQRTRQRLLEETEDPAQAQTLAERLLSAATDRLVLLVAPDAGYIGFEIRSLQEFMAARALISGPEADIVPRLESLATDSTWRNTWMLAVAGLFTHRPHLRGDLLNALRQLDSRDSVTMTLLPGAQLALDLLDDDVTRQHPRFHNLLIQHAAALIGQGPRGDLFINGFADILARAAEQHDQARAMIEHAIKDALSARDARLLTALEILTQWQDGPRHLAATARQLLAVAVSRLTDEERAGAIVFSVQDWADSIPGLPRHSPSPEGDSNLADFLRPHLGDTVRNAPASRILLDALKECPVHQEIIEGVPAPCANPYMLDIPITLSGDEIPDLQNACIKAIDSQTIAAWDIGMTFLDVLQKLTLSDLQYHKMPHVSGLS
ncbi:NACHT domain-containing protein [Streptomyces sp. NPDC056697]|uniref:NACHT domain-containing protein n=1 Tax=Streptomyces sp. NPDC056697 TaxID=3345915 RepID=UPI003681B38D